MTEADINILVVEDEETVRDIFQQALSNWGFTVDCAADGKTALRFCHNKNYHMVITDINMPLMDGMSLLNKIKSRWPYIEVILMTGFGSIEDAIEALKIGAFDFILKPVNFDHIKLTVKKCFQKIASEAEKTELSEKNIYLRELNEMKDKFLSITNHEIRTPLMIIKGYLEILELQLEAEDESTAEVLNIIKNNTENLSETVERMHTLSKITDGNWYGKIEKIEINEITKNVYQNFLHLFSHRNINITLILSKNPLFVKGNSNSMKLVIRELLSNALKFTENGGRVKVKISEMQNQVVLNVRDTGIGVPFDKQQLIFSGFYEVQDVMNHKSSSAEFMGGGMGIGLSLVKEIINSMKGKIELFSELDKGSSFIIYLPKYNKRTLNLKKSENIEKPVYKAVQ